MKVTFILPLLLVCPLAWGAPAASFDGRVNRFVDGDTLWIQRGDKEVKVRLWLADAPEIKHRPKEKNQPGGPEALAYANKKWTGADVQVTVKGESYGRVVGEVVEKSSSESIGLALVASGHAAVDRRFSPPQPYLAAEQAAREKHRGIWEGGETITLPWDWRKQQRARRPAQ